MEGATDPWEMGVDGGGKTATATEEVDLEAHRELRGKVGQGRRRRGGEPAEEWRQRVRRSTGDSMRGVPSDWHTGGSKTTATGSGAHVVQVLGGCGREVVRYGGEARFLAGDGLDEEGCMEGWGAEYARLRGRVSFDAEGWPCDGDRTRLVEEQVAALPPLLQLECRARWALGDVPIFDEGDGNKRTETHINLQLQRRNHEWFCEWQARLGITVAYSLDATHYRGEE